MSSSWGCPHESQGKCGRRNGQECDVGAAGCVLEKALQRSAQVVAGGGDESRTEERKPPDPESSQ